MIFMGMVKYPQSFQSSKFAMSLQYLKKEVRDEVDSLHADKHQSFLQVDFNTLEVKVVYKVILSLLMDMIKHFQGTRCNKFVISFAIYMSKKKKKLGIEFIFCMQINIKTSTNWHYNF